MSTKKTFAREKINQLGEKTIERLILDYLNIYYAKDGFFVKYDYPIRVHKAGHVMKSSNPHVHNGTSDILGIYKGLAVAIEVKTESEYKKIKKNFNKYYGRTNDKNRDIARYANQIEFLENYKKKGGLAGFAYTVEQAKRIVVFGKSHGSLFF